MLLLLEQPIPPFGSFKNNLPVLLFSSSLLTPIVVVSGCMFLHPDQNLLGFWNAETTQTKDRAVTKCIKTLLPTEWLVFVVLLILICLFYCQRVGFNYICLICVFVFVLLNKIPWFNQKLITWYDGTNLECVQILKFLKLSVSFWLKTVNLKLTHQNRWQLCSLTLFCLFWLTRIGNPIANPAFTFRTSETSWKSQCFPLFSQTFLLR